MNFYELKCILVLGAMESISLVSLLCSSLQCRERLSRQLGSVVTYVILANGLELMLYLYIGSIENC